MKAVVIVLTLAAAFLFYQALNLDSGLGPLAERVHRPEPSSIAFAREYPRPVQGSRVTIYRDIPFALFHKTCGGLAFFINHRPVPGTQARAADVAMSDGRRPVAFELALCSTCGRVVALSYRGENGLCFEGECE